MRARLWVKECTKAGILTPHMPPTREVGVPHTWQKQAVLRTEAVTVTSTSSQACVLSRRKCNTRRQQATESGPLHKHSTAPCVVHISQGGKSAAAA